MVTIPNKGVRMLLGTLTVSVGVYCIEDYAVSGGGVLIIVWSWPYDGS